MLVELFTGPIHSGKTTLLAAWCAAQPVGTVGGVLQPKQAGKRFFGDVTTGEEIPLEAPADAPDEAVQRVGRFTFAAAAFEWAADRLARAAADVSITTIVIDEIGPLELRGQGLDAAVHAVLAVEQPGKRVVLVVREALAEAVRARYVGTVNWEV